MPCGLLDGRVCFDRTVSGTGYSSVLSLNRYLLSRLALRTRRRRSSAPDEVSGCSIRVGANAGVNGHAAWASHANWRVPGPCLVSRGWPNPHAAAIDRKVWLGTRANHLREKGEVFLTKTCFVQSGLNSPRHLSNTPSREAVAQTR